MPEVQYKTLQIPLPLAGLNTRDTATNVDSKYSPYMNNMVIDGVFIRKRYGYSKLGAVDLPLNGIGMRLIDYVDALGASHLIAITTTNAYEYDGTNWFDITPGTETAVEDCEDNWDDAGAACTSCLASAEQAVEGTNSIKVVCAAAVSDGDKICYEDFAAVDINAKDSIVFSIYPVTNGIPVGHLELCVSESANGAKSGTYVVATNAQALVADQWNVVVFPVSLSSLNAVVSVGLFANDDDTFDSLTFYIDDVKAQESILNGDEDDLIRHTVAYDTALFTGNGGAALVVTNGTSDGAFYYEGQNGDKFQKLSSGDWATTVSVREIAEFWNHFICADYTDTGSSRAARGYKYADIGNIDDFSVGNSDAGTLTDLNGIISALKRLKQDIIIYAEKSIAIVRYVGGTALYVFPMLTNDFGLVSPTGVATYSDAHFILGSDLNIYRYSGEVNFERIGEHVSSYLFNDTLDYDRRKQIGSGVIASRKKAYFFLPHIAETGYGTKFMSYNFGKELTPWEYGEFTDDVRDISTFRSTWGLRFNSPDLSAHTFASMAGKFSDSSGSVGFDVPVFIDSSGYVFKLTDELFTDDGTDFECELQTMDLTLDSEAHYFRTQWFSFSAMSRVASSTIKVEYATDGGLAADSWIELEDSPVSLESNWKHHRLFLDITTRKIRFRFSQTSGDFRLRSMQIKVIPKTDVEDE